MRTIIDSLKATHRAEGLLDVPLFQEKSIIVPDDSPGKVGWNTGHLNYK